MTTKHSLSVVIPTYNASSILENCYSSLKEATSHFPITEVIVVDAHSTDDTVAVAESLGAKVIGSERGRGIQLDAGARVAMGSWILFIHADTALQTDWATEAVQFIKDPKSAYRGAVFRFRLDDHGIAAQLLEQLVALRCRILALPYGDQALLLRRSFYHALGGFLPIPIMEDVDLVRRIGRKKLTYLRSYAVTSSQRYKERGYLLRMARNVLCLALYFLGISPRIIHNLYQ
tara:strand:- start:412 stop:1107 length:696 start_codon:yes stop_codon:yes gene_type:complete